MAIQTTTTPQQTQKLAKDFARHVQPGELYTFSGDLGAGKTTFIQGILGALGAAGPFPSPTFTIVNTYTLSPQSRGYANGIHTVYHMDAYRIDDQDVENIGWQEMRNDTQAVILLEWPEKIASHIPHQATALTFTWQEDFREIILP